MIKYTITKINLNLLIFKSKKVKELSIRYIGMFVQGFCILPLTVCLRTMYVTVVRRKKEAGVITAQRL